jgi:RHS repeat-associated protein
MGNITRLERYGNIGQDDYTPTQKIDNLILTYSGNQLKSANESVTAYNLGFLNPAGTPPALPYAYNKNGAITQDYYRGISGIEYNALNLPNRIQFMYGHNTQYGYDASGVKRWTIHETAKNNLAVPLGTTNRTLSGGSRLNTLTVDYCGNGHIVYENGQLKQILTPEGYLSKTTKFVYNYYLKDHLGNNRSVITWNGNSYSTSSYNISQETNYYPFGMTYPAAFYGDAYSMEKQPYKFGGKELDEMHGLNWADFEARHYDGIVPRFTTMDPLAEKYYSVSPYAYCLNNPVKYVDPTGLAPIYDPNGNLIGTDDGGLQGKAIVMNVDDFSQGMSHKSALTYNLGATGFANQEATDKFTNHYNGLKDRPDYDGKLTLSEANDWYSNGNGEPLYVDASKIDLSPVTTEDMNVGEGKVFNFASPRYANTETGLVYGNIKLTLLNSQGSVLLGGKNGLLDNYGFEMHEGGSKFRNFATKIGKAIAGSGISYDIYNYKYGTVKVK